MAQRTEAPRARKVGRPHKGARHLFQTRVPVPLADIVMEAAERAGMTYSDYLALLVAEKHGYEIPEYLRPSNRDNQSVQEVLPMPTAV